MKTNLSIYDDERDIEIFPQGKLFRISFDSSVGKMRLICFNSRDLDEIRKVYSDVNPASFFMKQYGYSIDQRLYVINQFGYFDPGFFFEIIKYIRLQYGSLNVLAIGEHCRQFLREKLTPIKTILKTLSKTEFEVSNISEDSGRNAELISQGKNPYLFRDYQKTAIEKLLFEGYGRGIIELPTASGKSMSIANFIYNIQKNINKDYVSLILVPNKQLVSQMYNDFLDYGYNTSDITKFTAGLKKNEKYDPNKKIIIANRQYVFSNKELLPKIDVLFCDEVHQCGNAEATRSFIESIECGIKVGCSGSIPRNKFQRWTLIGMFGNIVHKEEITDLQKRGFISKLKLYQISIKDMVVENDRNYLFHLHPLRKYSPDEMGYSEIPFNAAHDAEHEYYEKHYKDLYTPALEYISKFDENTLILFERLEFGKRLFEISHEIFKGKQIHYIDGSVDVKDRLKIVDEMESNGNNVLFAENATFSTGINVKRLTNLVFVSSSKSFPRLLQSVGRTLRLHDTKNEARIFEIDFNFKYSQRHHKERMQIYKESYNKVPDEKIEITI